MFRPVVQKFGGTSVQDAEAMDRVIEIVLSKGVSRKLRPLVVLSACSGVTNALIRVGESSLKEQTKEALQILDQNEARHLKVLGDLVTSKARLPIERSLQTMWNELRRLVTGVHLLRELTPRSKDQFQSVGERASTLIFAAALAERTKRQGLAVHLLDAREFFITTREYTMARPLPKEISRKMRNIRRAITGGAIGVTQGFIGATAEGVVTTIGRGGSDFSAAIQGVAIGAAEIQIWTDVAGIMTCDPRIASRAFTLPQVSFSDASQLAFFGAKVLHPETIWPAVEAGIPVRVLSSKEPDREGTLILEEVFESRPVTGIAVKRNITLIKITSKSTLPDAEAQQIVWDIISGERIVPLAVSLSVDDALYAFDDNRVASHLRAHLEGIATIETSSDKDLISLVGSGLKSNSGIAARMFRSLGKSNCDMISYGGSDATVSFVVDSKESNKVVRRLHREFFE